MPLPSKRKILEHFDDKDAVMAGVIRRGGPFKLNRNKNYFQVLCKAIVGQQISTKAAESINQRFQNLFTGNRPTPRKVRSLAEKQLREVGLSGQKVKYMKDLRACEFFIKSACDDKIFPCNRGEFVRPTAVF